MGLAVINHANERYESFTNSAVGSILDSPGATQGCGKVPIDAITLIQAYEPIISVFLASGRP